MFILGGDDAPDGAGIFLDFLPEGAGAFSVEDADGGDVEHDGVVEVVLDDFQRVGHAEAPDVDLRPEIALALLQRGVIALAGRLGTLLHGALEFVGGDPLDAVARDFRGDAADDDADGLGGELADFPDHAVVLDADLFADFQRRGAEGDEFLLLALGLGHAFACFRIRAAGLAGLFLLLPLLEGLKLLFQVFLAVAAVGLFLLAEGADELLEFAAGVLGGLFFGLGLLDGADGVLHLPVGLADDFLRLLPGLVEDVPAELLDVGEFFLVFVRDGLEGLVGGPDLLELLVEGAAAPGDAPEIALDADEFFAGAFLRIPDDVLGQAHLAGEFEGEGVAREADFKLEERGDALGVELHGTTSRAYTSTESSASEQRTS